MKNNPFNLTFGKEPSQMIERFSQADEITTNFLSDTPSQQIYMITGVRGSGKTVFMTTISKKMKEHESWVIVELNSSGELLKELAAKLYNIKGMSKVFEAEGINLSFWGIGVNIKKAEPITDLTTAIERMLEQLTKKKKKILIAIDEVYNNSEMKYFAGSLQMLIRHDYPVYVIMTGLYENINKLQNEDNLTFLYRAPKIYLEALSTYRISDHYENLLNLSKEDAMTLARMTKGYPFAFQVIGYFSYNNKGDFQKCLPEIKGYLKEYVYDKVLAELSEKEKKLLELIAIKGIKEVKKLRDTFNQKSNEFSIYRDRLIKKGILSGSRRGYLEFTLPFFEEYLNEESDCYDYEQAGKTSYLGEMLGGYKYIAKKEKASDGKILLSIKDLEIEVTGSDEKTARKLLATRIKTYAEEYYGKIIKSEEKTKSPAHTLYVLKALSQSKGEIAEDIDF